jgi:phosphoglycerol geranylgeranyltransferase
MYALSAQFMGMRFVYLEAGSGAKSNVKPEMVAAVRKLFKGFLIVGGGIRSPETAEQIAKACADAIVIGTFIEKGGSFKTISDIVKAIQSVRK